MKIYYGLKFENGHEPRNVYATVTGQMSDGTMVYTEIEQTEDGAIKEDNGEAKLILDNQFTRHIKHGTQTFERI